MPSAEVSLLEQLSSMGVDSLMAVELRNRTQRELSIEIPITLFMDAINISEVARELARRIEKQPASVTNNKDEIEYVEGAL
jgi:acyl carrier protein